MIDVMSATVRLAPGVQVFRFEGCTVLHSGGDEFLVPDLSPEAQDDLARVLVHGLPPGACTALSPAELEAILDELREEDLLAADPRPIPEGRVVVHGDNPVGREVGRLLNGSGLCAVTDIDPAALGTHAAAGAASVDMVVACAGWLPDSAWQSLDRHLAGIGVPWHRCYGDATAFHLGPLTVPGNGPGYLDVRARRLAATDEPELLMSLWRHLDGQTDSSFSWPGLGAVAVLAGHLVDDVLTYLSSGVAPAVAVERELRRAGLHRLDHPVLPVPRPAGVER